MKNYYLMRHKLIYEEAEKIAQPFLSMPENAVEFAKPFFDGADRELVYVCCTDAKLYPISMEMAAMGCRTSTSMDMPSLFKTAITFGAQGIIVFHNHLSADPTPSKADAEITGMMELCGIMLGIQVLDHIIFSRDGSYYSMAQHGFMANGRKKERREEKKSEKAG